MESAFPRRGQRPTARQALLKKQAERRSHALDVWHTKRGALFGMKRKIEDETEPSTNEGTTAAKVIQLRSQLSSQDTYADRASVTLALRRALSCGERQVEAFLEGGGGMELLISLLADPSLVLEATGCIANIAASDEEQHVLSSAVAVPQLIPLLSSSSVRLRDQAAWALGNIAGDSLESAEHLVVQGAASGFAMMVAATGASRAVAFAVSNLARLSSAVEPLLVGGVLLPALVQLYRTGDISEAAEAGWALAHLAMNTEVASLLAGEHISQIVRNVLVSSTDDVRFGPTLRLLGAMVAAGSMGTLVITSLFADGLVLQALARIVQAPPDQFEHLQVETAWIIANLLVIPVTSQLVVSMIPGLVALLPAPASCELQKEVLHALLSAGHVDPTVLSNIGVVPIMLQLLCSPDSDVQSLSLQMLELICRVVRPCIATYHSYHVAVFVVSR